jgi:hypothetical protein
MKKGGKQQLLEMMIKVNPEAKEDFAFGEYLNNQHLYENNDVEIGEEEQEITPEEQQQANALNQSAETAVESEEDIQQPLTNQHQKGIDMTVIVPTYKKRLADQNIESLRKLARKLRIPEPEVTEGTVYQKRVTEPCEIPPCDTYIIDVYDLSIKTEGMFKLPGNYKLVAVVDNITGGSIEIDPDEVVPQEQLEPSGQCDLCQQERFRGKNFIVKNLDDNKYLCLGSSCVKKYIGVNVAKYIKVLDYFRDFTQVMSGFMDEDDLFGGEGGGGRRGMNPSNRVVDINKVISIIHNLIETDGFEKREWDEREVGGGYHSRWERFRTNEGNATADKAEKIIYKKEDFDNYPVDAQYVNEFKKFANSLEPIPDGKESFNEYREKIKNFGTDANFRIKDTALLASGINYFENEKKRQAEAERTRDSQWIGNVGEKVRIPYAKLENATSGEGAYGTWFLWTFIDDNGNVLKKFGNLSDKFIIENAPEGSPELYSFHKGDVFAFTAEIKKHEEYKGTKNTQLGRLSKY